MLSGSFTNLANWFNKKTDASVNGDGGALTGHETLVTQPLSVVVFGATGDLARKKLFPALYQLCVLGRFPRDLKIVACGRQLVDRDAFLSRQLVNVREDARFSLADFSACIQLHAGGYDALEAYVKLNEHLRRYERTQHEAIGSGQSGGNRLFVLAVPSTCFGPICEHIATYARAAEADSESGAGGGFTRVLVEKPFGHDAASFASLHQLTSRLYRPHELYRLDHYLGKEVLLNLPSVRWANQLFEPTWNAKHIESVQFTFKEDLGTGGRGGYFERVGIVREVMLTHLLQAFLWVAMEPPKSMSAADLAAAKVALLQCVPPPSLHPDEAFFAQYGPCGDEGGYLDDETVPAGSRCPTFASLVLHVHNERWRGVPFLFTAGKGLDERVCELRVRFKPQRVNELLGELKPSEHRNELVVRMQPDEAVYMLTTAKEPGIQAQRESVRKQVCMDMRHASQFADSYAGDAYERLLLSAGRGDQSLFLSAGELEQTWRIFTPLLQQMEREKPQPVVHAFGMLPKGFVAWAGRLGVTIHPTWREFVATHAELVDAITVAFAELDEDNSGGLDAPEVANLARRFFDGREPTPQRIAAIFAGFDLDEDGKITLDELIAGAQKMHRAFSKDANLGGSLDEPCEHVHI